MTVLLPSQFQIEDFPMSCRTAASRSNGWSDYVLAAGYELLFGFGTLALPDSHLVYANLQYVIDNGIKSEFFLMPVSISIVKESVDQDLVARQAKNPALVIVWECQGRKLTLSITSQGGSSYAESFPEQVGISGPFDIYDVEQTHQLCRALLGLSNTAKYTKCQTKLSGEGCAQMPTGEVSHPRHVSAA